MNKKTQISIISTLAIIIAVLITLWAIPFYHYTKASNSETALLNLDRMETAVKTSIYPWQKAEMMAASLAELYYNEEYDKIIEYHEAIKRLKMHGIIVMPTYVIPAYIETGDYDKALAWANNLPKGSGKIYEVKTYIKMGDTKKAEETYNKIIEETLKPYKNRPAKQFRAQKKLLERRFLMAETRAQIELAKGEYNKALKDINIALRTKYISVKGKAARKEKLKIRAQIYEKLGQKENAQNDLKEIENIKNTIRMKTHGSSN